MEGIKRKPKVLIGVTGCIGVTNIESYLHILSKIFEVKVIMTKNSQEFIRERVVNYFADAVYTDLFREDNYVPHVSLVKESDVFVLIPASFNTISKVSHGIADNLLTASIANWSKPLIICPNMNEQMWRNPVFQDNISYLKEKGHIFLNENRQAYEVADKTTSIVESGLPTPDRLAKSIIEYLKN